MKGNSTPGIDGFTVNWLRKFWDSLKLMTFNAINECYRDLSPLLSEQAAEERAERVNTDWKLQANLTPINPLQACLVVYHSEASASSW